jgi:cell division protein FtsI/penicillin-binding protein 2
VPSRNLRSAVSLFAALCLLVGCTSSSPTTTTVGDPVPEVAAFAAAWSAGRLDEAGAKTSAPAEAQQLMKQVNQTLAPSKFVVTPGAVNRAGDTSLTAKATVSWTLGDAGTWSYEVDWPWVFQNGKWVLTWASTAVHPKLGDHQGITVRITKSTDGTVVDRDDNQILNPIRVYSVVARKDQISDLAGVAGQLGTLLAPFDSTVTADSVIAGVSGSEATTGYTVTNLREADYQTIAAELGKIVGISAPSETRNLPPTRNFAKNLLSQVNKTTTTMTKGVGGWKIVTVDASGVEVETLNEQTAKPGTKVTLTIDTKLQEAADAAVAAVQQPAAIVAIQPSTGEILAVSQNAAADAVGPIALSGRYAPGSTFKIVTATAGMDQASLNPASMLPCPASLTIGSRAVNNSHMFDLGTVDLRTAFAKSCNTTFAQISAGLPRDALTKTAKQYGIGLDFDITGIVTLTGQSPATESEVEAAAAGFGQGKNLMSPFGGALMAASVANGSMPMPVVIRGQETKVDAAAPARSDAAKAGLPVLMRAVTTDGTGRVLLLYGDIHMKTGTAEFNDATGAIHAHAWTVGYRGDMAFAALIVGGEDSGNTNTLMVNVFKAIG